MVSINADQYGFYRVMKNQSDCAVAGLNNHIFEHHTVNLSIKQIKRTFVSTSFAR